MSVLHKKVAKLITFITCKKMCSDRPDETSVYGLASCQVVMKCWCRRDFISDRLKSRSAHEGLRWFVKGFVLNAKRI